MPLTSQPTKTSDSLGVEKADLGTPPNQVNYQRAVETEKQKDYIIDVCGEVGNHVGTDATLNVRVDALETTVSTLEAVVPEGPGVTTDQAVARWNGTDGLALDNSLVTISDTGVITTPQQIVASDSNAAPPFTFSGDTDTGLVRSGADAVALMAGGNEQFVSNDTSNYSNVSLFALTTFHAENTTSVGDTDATGIDATLGSEWKRTAKITTTDGTTTTALTAPIPLNSGMLCVANIVCRTSGSAHTTYIRTCLVKNVGGTSSLVGSTSSTYTENTEDAVIAVAVDVDNATDTVRVRVTGKASTTCTWTVILTTQASAV